MSRQIPSSPVRPRFGVPRWLRVFLQYAIGLALLGAFLRQIDSGPFWAHVDRLHLFPVLVALLAYGIDFLLRAVRFWMLLCAASNRLLPWRSVPGPFIASFGISDLLPLRAGDLFRLFWFQRQMRLPGSTVFGAMVIERCLDLATLLLLGLLTFGTFLPAGQAAALMALLLIGGIALLLVLRAIPFARRSGFRQSWRGRLADGALDALSTFRIFQSLPLSLGLVALSLLCWMLESVVLIAVWVGLGGELHEWVKPMAGFVASTLATLVPSLPGHFGTFELLGMEMFRRLDVAPNFAAAVLLVGHMLLWAPTALFAALWFVVARPYRPSGQAAQQTEGLLRHGRAMR